MNFVARFAFKTEQCRTIRNVGESFFWINIVREARLELQVLARGMPIRAHLKSVDLVNIG